MAPQKAPTPAIPIRRRWAEQGSKTLHAVSEAELQRLRNDPNEEDNIEDLRLAERTQENLHDRMLIYRSQRAEELEIGREVDRERAQDAALKRSIKLRLEFNRGHARKLKEKADARKAKEMADARKAKKKADASAAEKRITRSTAKKAAPAPLPTSSGTTVGTKKRSREPSTIRGTNTSLFIDAERFASMQREILDEDDSMSRGSTGGQGSGADGGDSSVTPQAPFTVGSKEPVSPASSTFSNINVAMPGEKVNREGELAQDLSEAEEEPAAFKVRSGVRGLVQDHTEPPYYQTLDEDESPPTSPVLPSSGHTTGRSVIHKFKGTAIEGQYTKKSPSSGVYRKYRKESSVQGDETQELLQGGMFEESPGKAKAGRVLRARPQKHDRSNAIGKRKTAGKE